MTQYIICPTCNKEADLSKANPYRPFCSERCKLIDLGQWVEEKYKISEQDNQSNNINQDPSFKH